MPPLRKKFIFGIIFLPLILGANLALAQGHCEPCTGTCDPGLLCEDGKCQYICPQGKICIKNPLTACSIEDIVEKITTIVFWLGTILVPLMVLIGAFYMITAGGSAERVKKAKNIFMYAAIGLAILLFAKALSTMIKWLLGAG